MGAASPVSSSGSGCLPGTITQGPSQWSGPVWVGFAVVLLQKTKLAPRPGQAPTTPAVLLLGTASPVTPSCTADCRAPTCPCHCTEPLGCLSRILGGGASTYPWRPLASGHLGPSLPVTWMSPQMHISSSCQGARRPACTAPQQEASTPNPLLEALPPQGPYRGHQRGSRDRPQTSGLPLEPIALLPLALLSPYPQHGR